MKRDTFKKKLKKIVSFTTKVSKMINFQYSLRYNFFYPNKFTKSINLLSYNLCFFVEIYS